MPEPLLVRSTGQFGEWVRDGAADGQPGTYALIIGVSDYSGPDIPKLGTSAFTAARFFRWLARIERAATAPLRRCWVLLSPTSIESGQTGAKNYLELEPGSYVPATFEGITGAVSAWYQAMSLIPNGTESRAIFYFCGHGVEHVPGHQVLLPEDYLTLRQPSKNRALATSNLIAGLATVPVRTQFYYLDACRNSGKLRGIVPPTGFELLDVPTENVKPRQAITVLATIGGSVTAQYADPKDGGSFFGDALHEALTSSEDSQPPFQPDCSSKPCTVKLYPLHGFLNARVSKLMQYAPGTTIVSVSGQITNFDTVVAEVPDHTPPVPAGVLRGGPTRGILQQAIDYDDIVETVGTLGPNSVNVSVANVIDEGNQGEQELEALHSIPGIPKGGVRTQTPPTLTYETACSILGHEWYGRFFSSAKCFISRDMRSWRASNYTVSAIQLEQQDYGINFRFRTSAYYPDEFVWITFSNQDGMESNFMLPPNLMEADLEVRTVWHGGKLVDSFCDLALSNVGLFGTAATLWTRYQNLSAFKDPGELPIDRIAESTLQAKFRNNIAATIALLILLRASRYDLIHDWDSNLVQIANTSDAAILALERHLNDPNTIRSPEKVATYLTEIVNKGVPTLGESFGSLLKSAELLRDDKGLAGVLGKSRSIFADPAYMNSFIDALARVRSTSSLFSSFKGPEPLRWQAGKV